MRTDKEKIESLNQAIEGIIGSKKKLDVFLLAHWRREVLLLKNKSNLNKKE
jgi:hypothetical protein